MVDGVVDEDPLGILVKGRTVQSQTSSSLQRALKWVSQCDAEHKGTRCHLQRSALPTRIIDIKSSSPSGVALYASNAEDQRYATLSYVWGAANSFITTKESFEAHQTNIDPTKLPKTFQDAIEMTRMLNLRYLWIDALW